MDDGGVSFSEDEAEEVQRSPSDVGPPEQDLPTHVYLGIDPDSGDIFVCDVHYDRMVQIPKKWDLEELVLYADYSEAPPEAHGSRCRVLLDTKRKDSGFRPRWTDDLVSCSKSVPLACLCCTTLGD